MSNKQIVIDYMTAVLIDRDFDRAKTFWGSTMTQHNPHMPNGHEPVGAFISAPPEGFGYKMGIAAETGNYVMVHGQYSGWQGKTMIAVDIFRVEEGKVVEHWDVMQEDVPAELSVNGNAMFPIT